MKLDMMTYLKSFRLIFVFFILSKYVLANENDKIYFINSKANISNEINQNSIENLFENNNLNLIYYGNNIFSIFDQADAYDKITKQDEDKIIIYVDKYYLESILFESDYFLISCFRDEIICEEKQRITYNEVFYPLINILHKRLLNSYFENFDKEILLIFNNILSDNLLRKYFTNYSFLSNNMFCVIENLNKFEKCIDEFISN